MKPARTTPSLHPVFELTVARTSGVVLEQKRVQCARRQVENVEMERFGREMLALDAKLDGVEVFLYPVDKAFGTVGWDRPLSRRMVWRSLQE